MALQSAFLLAQDVEGPVNGLKGDLITQWTSAVIVVVLLLFGDVSQAVLCFAD